MSFQVGKLQVKRIFLNERERIPPRLKRFGQHGWQVGIALDGRDVLRVLQQGHGERADAGADFKHVVRALELRQRHDLRHDGLIDQEVLPKRVLSRKPMVR